jgi:hypothetical protein
MFAAELVLVDKNLMPKTHNELKEWVIEKSQQKDYLVKTDVALDVYDIIGGGPVPKHIKPIWPFISFEISFHFCSSFIFFIILLSNLLCH